MLKKILLADFIAGFVTAAAGLILYRLLTTFLGLPANLVIIIATVTLLYSILAFILARQNMPSVKWLKILVYANWTWTVVSIVLLILYISRATVFGGAFLILQVIIVGGLAWLEGRYLQKPV